MKEMGFDGPLPLYYSLYYMRMAPVDPNLPQYATCTPYGVCVLKNERKNQMAYGNNSRIIYYEDAKTRIRTGAGTEINSERISGESIYSPIVKSTNIHAVIDPQKTVVEDYLSDELDEEDWANIYILSRFNYEEREGPTKVEAMLYDAEVQKFVDRGVVNCLIMAVADCAAEAALNDDKPSISEVGRDGSANRFYWRVWFDLEYEERQMRVEAKIASFNNTEEQE